MATVQIRTRIECNLKKESDSVLKSIGHDAVSKLDELRIPPGNHLEALKRDRSGQHSIRVDDRYRVCFRWDGHSAHEVEITDYH